MQRRSSRLASSSAGKTSPSDAAKTVSRSQSGSDKQRNDLKLRDDGDKSVQPKKKRQKVAQKSTSNTPGSFKNVRGRRGALKGIVEMPLDILHETFMYLTSVEILHLSRRCKNLRRVLMTSSAEHIWKQARINLDDDFPECPDDLNEAQLAAFVFDGLCYYCSKQKGLYFIWSNRRRCCKKCINGKRKGFVDLQSLSKKIKSRYKGNLDSSLWKLLPSIYLGKSIRELDWREGFSNDEYHRICLESAINIYQEYMKIQPQDRDKWVKARHRERRRRMRHGERLNGWLVQRSEDRSEHLRDVRERRYKAIRQRLIDLGWEREFNACKTIMHLPSVKLSNELTDRGWESIKDGIIEELEPVREELARRDRHQAQMDRKDLLEKRVNDIQKEHFHKKLFPKDIVSWLLTLKSVSALIEAPLSEQVEFSDSFLLKLVEGWLDKRPSRLRLAMNSSSTQAQVLRPRPIDPLLLATTFFEPSSESFRYNFYQYPDLLLSCSSMTKFKFATKPFYIAKAILEASGIDPDTTTRDVVETDFYIECLECPSDTAPGKRYLMTWMTSIYHALHKHRHVECPRMVRARLTETELKVTRDLAVDTLIREFSSSIDDLECVRCEVSASSRSFVGNIYTLRPHLQNKHSIFSYPNHLQDFVFVKLSGYYRQPSNGFLVNRIDCQEEEETKIHSEDAV